MAIFNSKTNERKLVGKIISERGTFRFDAAHDEIVYWDDKMNKPNTMYLSQGDWYVERGQDLDPETKAKYEEYYNQQMRDQDLYLSSCEDLTVKINSEVLVYKGRKIPQGTIGHVVAKTIGRFGTSILIKRSNCKLAPLKEFVWVSLDNCKLNVNGIWLNPRG